MGGQELWARRNFAMSAIWDRLKVIAVKILGGRGGRKRCDLGRGERRNPAGRQFGVGAALGAEKRRVSTERVKWFSRQPGSTAIGSEGMKDNPCSPSCPVIASTVGAHLGALTKYNGGSASGSHISYILDAYWML